MNGKLVYSTDHGRICHNCEKPEKQCICKAQKKAQVVGDGNVRVRRETASRGGKTVSAIHGLAMNEDELKALTKKLKQICGTGGTYKNGVIEIQGDHVDKLIAELSKQGINAKRGGG
jgi:translation initiation factor 1